MCDLRESHSRQRAIRKHNPQRQTDLRPSETARVLGRHQRRGWRNGEPWRICQRGMRVGLAARPVCSAGGVVVARAEGAGGTTKGWYSPAGWPMVGGGGGGGGGGAVVVEARGLRSAGGGGSRAKPEGRPRLRSARSLARARSLAYAAIGWPGVFPWIRRSRLDIDKWLTEGEPNTAPLLHMQGHPFVRAGVRRGPVDVGERRKKLRRRGHAGDDRGSLRPLRVA